MRNLKILTQQAGRLAKEDAIFSNECCCSIDSPSGRLYLVTANLSLVVYDLRNCSKLFCVNLLFDEDGDGLLDNDDGPIDIEYLAEVESVCIATKAGRFVSVRVQVDQGQLGENCTRELVGLVSVGMSSVKWSPDQEFCAVATNNNTVLLMNNEFEVMHELPVDVKAMDDPEYKELDAEISWRGDGNFFCCNSLNSKTNRRKIRVWDRNLDIQSTSEDVENLSSLLCWRPEGDLVTSSQKRYKNGRKVTSGSESEEKKELLSHEIIFFEKNGLRHGQFSLRDLEAELLYIKWNSVSDVLALVCKDSKQKNCTNVQLWTMMNYKWDMKHNFRITTSEVANFCWDPEHPSKFALVTKDGEINWIHFCWDFNVSCSSTYSGAVVDGQNIRLTPLAKAMIPPPMCASTIHCPPGTNARCISFSDQDEIAVVTDTNEILIYDPVDFAQPFEAPVLRNSFRLSDKTDYKSGIIRHLTWINGNTLACAVWKSERQCDDLVEIEFDETEITRIQETAAKSGLIFGLLVYQNFVLAQLSNGSVVRYRSRRGCGEFEAYGSFPAPCPSWSIVEIGDPHNAEYTLIGIDGRSEFYVGEDHFPRCTSFHIHPSFLIFIQGGPQNVIFFLQLDKPLEKEELQDAHSVRLVERGSLIVSSISSSNSVVLELPRGNLEVIYPRALMLNSLSDNLRDRDYRKAFLCIRDNRIDFNLLHDNNPKDFLEHAKDFVTQVPEVKYLNLFFTALNNSDVTKTLYPGYRSQTPFDDEYNLSDDEEHLTSLFHSEQAEHQHKYVEEQKQIVDADVPKVDLVCQTLREIMIELNSDHYLLAILTTFLKQSDPMLESALLYVKELRDRPGKSSISAESALEYVIFLADVTALYNVALGLYDFDLVMMVVQQGKEFDPREYLPFLSKLQKMNKFEQRFAIDVHLKRYESALQNLNELGDSRFGDCLSLICEHGLYLQGIKLWDSTVKSNANGNIEKWKKVMEKYGDSLLNKNPLRSGRVYQACGLKERSLEGFKKAGSWENAFITAHQLNYNPKQLQLLAFEIVETLKSEHRFGKAAQVLLDYCKDVDGAVVLMLKDRLWTQCLRAAYSNGREDLVKTTIEPAVVEDYHRTISTIDHAHESYEKNTKRLRALRHELLLNPQKFDEHKDDEGFGETESMMSSFTWSSLTSGTSFSSYVSQYSSNVSHESTLSKRDRAHRRRMKKKREKKRIKQGDPREEGYLISQIKDRTPSQHQITRIASLIRALISIDHLKEASILQTTLQKFFDLVKQEEATPMSALPKKTDDGETVYVSNWPQEVHVTGQEKRVIDDVSWKVDFLSDITEDAVDFEAKADFFDNASDSD